MDVEGRVAPGAATERPRATHDSKDGGGRNASGTAFEEQLPSSPVTNRNSNQLAGEKMTVQPISSSPGILNYQTTTVDGMIAIDIKIVGY